MSDLPNNLVDDFALTVIGEETVGKTKTIYGTAVVRGTQKYVIIDGTNFETPVNEAVEIEDGDRLLLELEHREVTAIGNITAPASARTASGYMKLTDDGLMVGKLDKEGNPESSYTLMKWDSFCICDKNAGVLAEFSSSRIRFGNKAEFGEDGVKLNDGSGANIATFTRDGINFQNKAVFDTNGVSLKNGSNVDIAKFTSAGLELFNNTGKQIANFTGTGITFGDLATFSPSGITFGDKASFTPTELSLGANESTVKLGKDGSGNPILTISKDWISANSNEMTFSAKRTVNLYVNYDSNNYVYLHMYLQNNNTPKIDIWGNVGGITAWSMYLHQQGVEYNTNLGAGSFKMDGSKLAKESYVDSKTSPIYKSNGTVNIYTKDEVYNKSESNERYATPNAITSAVNSLETTIKSWANGRFALAGHSH